MKFKINLIAAFIIILIGPVQAQNNNGVAPDFAVLQYAGSIGYVSVGTGYKIFKNTSRLSFHYGTVPKSKGGVLQVISTKLFFQPTSFNLRNKITITPIDIGLMVSYHFGDNFKAIWPSELEPKGYYWWPSALRAHLALESGVSFNFGEHNKIHSITAYVEFNTNDLYMVSYFQNADAIKLHNLIKLGAGARIHF